MFIIVSKNARDFVSYVELITVSKIALAIFETGAAYLLFNSQLQATNSGCCLFSLKRMFVMFCIRFPWKLMVKIIVKIYAHFHS